MNFAIEVRNARDPMSTTILTQPRVSFPTGPRSRRWLDTVAGASGRSVFFVACTVTIFVGHPLGHGLIEPARATGARVDEPEAQAKVSICGAGTLTRSVDIRPENIGPDCEIEIAATKRKGRSRFDQDLI
jgi:hypothetical protein